jgi:hypothetical protein
LDDNRGFYRVTEVDPAGDYLVVTGASEFSGSGVNEGGVNDVIFGTPGDDSYAVLPTIHASPVGIGDNPDTPREGQNDLRVTAQAIGNSFADPGNSAYSIEPFSYTIIRPSTLFSQEALELVFFMRERMLSWMEEIETPSQGGKSGDYYVFQRVNLIKDIGSPTDPNDGLGVVSNAMIETLAGQVDVSPYANTSDCLSVLGRRFWTLDFRLDSETPPAGGAPYANFADGDGRPVLPDRIDDVLDREDRFRAQRFAWIKFRTDRVNGSLTNIDRFIIELPRRILEQEELLRLQEGLSET